MPKIDPRAELSPRDIVARGVFAEIAAGRGAFLDCRTAIGAHFPEAFPTVYAFCKAAGIDPVTQPIPVAPAAHYHMGGIATDERARSTVPGLWAVGEVASTGLHGANRLASNSLLEAVVFGARAAADIAALDRNSRCAPTVNLRRITRAGQGPAVDRTAKLARLRRTMTTDVGVVRDAAGLRKAIATLAQIEREAADDRILANMALAARFIATGALQREESRGAHDRSDFADTRPALADRSFLTLAELDRLTSTPAPAHPTRPDAADEQRSVGSSPAARARRRGGSRSSGRGPWARRRHHVGGDHSGRCARLGRDRDAQGRRGRGRAARRGRVQGARQGGARRGARRRRRTVKPGDAIVRVSGNARALLGAERVALNFLGHLSGIATLTRAYVDKIEGTRARIIDTRKTTPGLRAFEKHAVRAGGGLNHRFGLFDAILDQGQPHRGGRRHCQSHGRHPPARRPHGQDRGRGDVAELDEALAHSPDAVLLDNMPVTLLKSAVDRVGGRTVTEASGGVTLDTVRQVAETGVDLISVGALTHSAPSLDVGLDFDPAS